VVIGSALVVANKFRASFKASVLSAVVWLKAGNFTSLVVISILVHHGLEIGAVHIVGFSLPNEVNRARINLLTIIIAVIAHALLEHWVVLSAVVRGVTEGHILTAGFVHESVMPLPELVTGALVVFHIMGPFSTAERVERAWVVALLHLAGVKEICVISAVVLSALSFASAGLIVRTRVIVPVDAPVFGSVVVLHAVDELTLAVMANLIVARIVALLTWVARALGVASLIDTVVLVPEFPEFLVLWVHIPPLLIAHHGPEFWVHEVVSAITVVGFTSRVSSFDLTIEVSVVAWAVAKPDLASVVGEFKVITGHLNVPPITVAWRIIVFVVTVVLVPELIEIVVHVHVVLPELFLSHGSPEIGVIESFSAVLIVVFSTGVVTRLGASEVSIIASVVGTVDPAFLIGSHSEVSASSINKDVLAISVVGGVGTVDPLSEFFAVHISFGTVELVVDIARLAEVADVIAVVSHAFFNSKFVSAVIWVVAVIIALVGVVVPLIPEFVEVAGLLPVVLPELFLSHHGPEHWVLEAFSAILGAIGVSISVVVKDFTVEVLGLTWGVAQENFANIICEVEVVASRLNELPFTVLLIVSVVLIPEFIELRVVAPVVHPPLLLSHGSPEFGIHEVLNAA